MLGTLLLDKTWQFMDAIDNATDAKAIQNALIAVARRAGFEAIFAGVVPTQGLSPSAIRERVLLQLFPPEWAERYNSNGYVYRDPIVERLSLDRDGFTWHEAYESSQRPEDVAIIRGEASAFNLKSGYVVPVCLLDGSIAAVSFGGAHIDLSPDSRPVLAFTAHLAIGALICQRCRARRAQGQVSPREYDCLLWAAEGKTDWEIAKILNISKPTVAKHILSAREKLGAVTKAHAIAEALRKKIIR